jgi:LCP family protein required for cell wall assembly
LRRTWPQRLVVVMCLGVIGSALAAAWFVWTLYDSLAEVPRIQISGEVLRTETPPGLPVNFLLVGTDSARGLDPDDPILIDRVLDPEGRSLADTIMLLRLDPNSGSAWVLSLPRDLIVDIPEAQTHRINAALFVGGPNTLVETVSSNLDVVINHYVQLDFLGFREVVDVLGGVPVWFSNPARDLGSNLEVLTPGCHVLDGEDALAYVRGRQYEELIDESWVKTGGDDFRRIERQQDFLVLALDRAIDRGARSPTTLGSLLDAGAESVLLDSNLTLAELVDLGRAFSEFDPDSLNRLSLHLETIHDADGTYQGEQMIEDANDDVLDVFRGAADSVRPPEVAISVIGADEVSVSDAVTLLSGADVGFEILGRQSDAEPLPQTVIVHGPGERQGAVLLARYVDPVPFLVEDPDHTGITLALGADFRGIFSLVATPRAAVEAAVREAGEPATVPDLHPELFESTTTLAQPSTTDSTGSTSITAGAEAPGEALSEPEGVTVPTTTAGTRGRPPPGESCG